MKRQALRPRGRLVTDHLCLFSLRVGFLLLTVYGDMLHSLASFELSGVFFV